MWLLTGGPKDVEFIKCTNIRMLWTFDPRVVPVRKHGYAMLDFGNPSLVQRTLVVSTYQAFKKA